ncbi:phage tail tube protein [Sandarakinorhabdus sp. DWP1-3-1]|uniref:phage tail tube protein n=1 Tax=Sandarakinorhabdus sp. DWP1-3-1 TaxID=2804627 RepID=UPI003CF89646
MALPEVLEDGYVTILLGNGAGPEVFTAVCGLTTRGFVEQVNTADRFIRDCADPAAIPIRKLTKTGKQWSLSGSGYLARESLEMVQAASGVTKNWRFKIGEPAGDLVFGGYYAGPAMLTTISTGATEGDLVSIELTIQSDGPWTFTEV